MTTHLRSRKIKRMLTYKLFFFCGQNRLPNTAQVPVKAARSQLDRFSSRRVNEIQTIADHILYARFVPLLRGWGRGGEGGMGSICI